MLRFAEEILLLALDDHSGRLHMLPERALDFAVAGAMLLELAFEKRIDTDVTQLTILDPRPTGDVLLDQVLEVLPHKEKNLTIQKALARVALKAPRLREQLFERLVEKRVLTRKEERFLWVLNERRYPVIDDREEQEVKSRIRDVVLTPDAIPDPRDVVLICLVDACDLAHTIFSAEELDTCTARLKQIAQMDFIGQAIAKAIGEIQHAILEVIAYSGM